MAAAVAIFLAIFCRYKLAAGEKGMVLVLAASVEQAKVVFGYAKAFLETSPVLRSEVDEITRNEEWPHYHCPCQQLQNRSRSYLMCRYF